MINAKKSRPIHTAVVFFVLLLFYRPGAAQVNFHDGTDTLLALAKAKYASTSATPDDSLDTDLLVRFRDEVMSGTEHGARIIVAYQRFRSEVITILFIERPDLCASLVDMIPLLQPTLLDVLDGDGTLSVTQTQVDTLAYFFTNVAAAGSDSLQNFVADELMRLGPLDDYVGQLIRDVLATVLGDSIPMAVTDDRKPIPTDFVLEQNFPNPFNPSTQISYQLPIATEVELTIYNAQGQQVRTLVKEFQTAGQKSIVWDGKADTGLEVTSGMYFYQLRAGSINETKMMILIR